MMLRADGRQAVCWWWYQLPSQRGSCNTQHNKL